MVRILLEVTLGQLIQNRLPPLNKNQKKQSFGVHSLSIISCPLSPALALSHALPSRALCRYLYLSHALVKF